jgi:hypothetical protein
MTNTPMKKKRELPIPYQEYLLRIMFASFYPAIKMGIDLHYPLDTIKDMMTLALWREAKKKHNTINLISLIFGKSTRTLKSLSARYNKGHFFEETESNLCRQIENLLLSGPMTEEELSNRLPQYNEFDSTALAISMLLRSKRIKEIKGHDGVVKYMVITTHHNLYSTENWEARIDALNEHLEAIAQTVHCRFLKEKDDPRATARTFTFNASEEDIEAFQNELLDFIRTKYRELEQKATELEQSDPKQAEAMKAHIKTFSLYVGMAPQNNPRESGDSNDQ